MKKILKKRNIYVRYPPQDSTKLKAYMKKEASFYKTLAENGTACKRTISQLEETFN